MCSCANWRYRHLTGAPIGAIGPKGLSKGDVLAHGVWSDFENMVFSNSIRYVECNHMDCNSSTLDTVFNSVAKYITAPHCSVELPPDIVLRIKSPSQLENILRHYQIEQELFTKTSTR